MSALLQFPLFTDKPKKRKLSREERFREFHAANPSVYRTLAMRALNLKRMGFTAYSMRTLWEILRWERDRKRMRGADVGDYELDNCHAPFYARMLMRDYRQLKGFFEIREKRK